MKYRVVISIIIIGIFILGAVFAKQIPKYAYDEITIENRLQKPSMNHIFGTDELGRDIFSRLLIGSRVSILVGFTAALVSTFLGLLMGIIAGYRGGIAGTIILRVVDVFLEFPTILLAMVIMVVLGDKPINLFLAIGISSWSGMARIVYSEVLSIKESIFIKSSEAIGAGGIRIMFKHILPNCLPSIAVNYILSVPSAILSESSLSFLGIGLSGSFVSWGSMINNGRLYFFQNPGLCLIPGIALSIFVLSCNCVGNRLRSVVDPR